MEVRSSVYQLNFAHKGDLPSSCTKDGCAWLGPRNKIEAVDNFPSPDLWCYFEIHLKFQRKNSISKIYDLSSLLPLLLKEVFWAKGGLWFFKSWLRGAALSYSRAHVGEPSGPSLGAQGPRPAACILAGPWAWGRSPSLTRGARSFAGPGFLWRGKRQAERSIPRWPGGWSCCWNRPDPGQKGRSPSLEAAALSGIIGGRSILFETKSLT